MAVTINRYQGRLYLLGQLPHKDGSPGLKQQRIALKLDDTEANFKVAQKRLALIERQLKNGTFSWSDWSAKAKTNGPLWRDAIDLLYKKKVTHGKTKESTWNVNYMGSLKLLNPLEPVTAESMAKAMSRWSRDTYTYKKVWYLMKDIAYLLKMDFPEIPQPTYSQKSVELKHVPDDQEIVEAILSAPQPYRWYWGMAATYGLRPHEIERCTLIEKDYLQVEEETKTGFRTVIPVRREWVELFDLRNKQERPAERQNDTSPDAVSMMLIHQANKLGIKWKSYALRHAYAGRLWREGGSQLDVYTAARLMGHSVQIHTQTYRAFIDPNQVAIVAEAALDANRDRVAKQMEKTLQS